MKLLVLRGLPGAGKTPYAKQYPDAVICSADDFFVRMGEYEFDPSKIAEAHALCRRRVITAMTHKKPLIILDNTNTRHWEFSDYKLLAMALGYDFEVKVIGGQSMEDVRRCAGGSSHSVPEMKILEMAYRWED